MLHPLQAYVEEQERRRADEQKHEQQMQFMFMSFMHQMLSGAGQVYPPVPCYPPPTPSSAAFPKPSDRTSPSYVPLYPLSADGDASSGAPISPQSYYEQSP